MKEGLVPYDIANSIIQETWMITNQFYSIFNSKTSLQSLIGHRHVAILKFNDHVLALDPSDKQEKNNKRIEQFFAKIEGNRDIEILISGTGGYAKGFLLLTQDYIPFDDHRNISPLDDVKGKVLFYPSNIPNWGANCYNKWI